MRAVIINNFRRLMGQKQLLLLLLVFVTAVTAAAVFMSTNAAESWDIAVPDSSYGNLSPDSLQGSDQINWIRLEAEPLRSELVSGKYDALLEVRSDGSYELDTVKSAEEAEKILAAIGGQNQERENSGQRGTGTTVFGYLTMFLLLMGSMAMCFYSDDRAGMQLNRIAGTPVKIGSYLLGHSIFNALFLFAPTLLIITVLCRISGVSTGYSFLQLAGLLALICAFSTSFCLFLYSFFSNRAESAKMAGNTVIILTSILAGGFYAFEKGNPTLEMLITVLPQRSFLILASGLEQQAAAGEYLPALLYLLLLTGIFYLLSLAKVRREYTNKR